MSKFDYNFAKEVVGLCYKKFDKLPKSGKPITGKEWTLLSAIVKDSEIGLEVVSLATGSKCIGQNKMSRDGDIINDSHAEVLARRSFLRYLYNQIDLIKSAKGSSIFNGIDEDGKYVCKVGVTFHLFTSHIPCGDAAIFKYASNGKYKIDDKGEKRKFDAVEDSGITPSKKKKHLEFEEIDIVENVDKRMYDDHITGAKCLLNNSDGELLRQFDYHTCGVVRTKPGRGASTLSMSCSDKIAKWNCLGVQGALLSLLMKPLFLSSIIIGAKNDIYNEEALHRAVIQRVQNVPGMFSPALLHISNEFAYSRYKLPPAAPPSFSSIIWCNVPNRNYEVCVEGRRLGCVKKDLKRNVLSVTKKMFLYDFRRLTGDQFEGSTYYEIKQSAIEYQLKWKNVKTVLGGWTNKPIELVQFI